MMRVSCFIVFNLFLLEGSSHLVESDNAIKSITTEISMNDTQNRFYEPLGNNILFEHEEQTRQLGNDEESNHFVHLPDHLNNLRDVSDPSKVTDTPVFWHVSKSGGTTMVDIFSACFGFVVAAEIGVLEGHGEDEVC